MLPKTAQSSHRKILENISIKLKNGSHLAIWNCNQFILVISIKHWEEAKVKIGKFY